eukprot:CAMPEP_0203673976 /NCGR_PEP_ID=MMETSP0090-20130426/14582_1 /ASSEMBLY_ACC=CAM_ASM_001088 /TAXON_ID=426623 /ORGANISM="Chaetoceros affinis, Strain CCMP159" /LENGTH=531 /DNA_ID=CAMNT_0050539743 /DNA_START=60 /DNA_END=1655 /DNA_ORIENTATION=+
MDGPNPSFSPHDDDREDSNLIEEDGISSGSSTENFIGEKSKSVVEFDNNNNDKIKIDYKDSLLDDDDDDDDDGDLSLGSLNEDALPQDHCFSEGTNIAQPLKKMVHSERVSDRSPRAVDRSSTLTALPIHKRLFGCFGVVWGWIRNPYEAYVDFMYHVFDLSFGMLMLYFTIFFYVQCIIFAILIYLVGLIEPECVVFDGRTLNEVTLWFDACWTLSWTTFSTTGYGNTAPALSESDGEVMDGVHKCVAINILLMVVSFVGIVYAGAAGAILYSKVEKIKGEGQVSFSDPCVIRFGSGLVRIGAENEEDELDEERLKKTKNLCPCPVLEFRLLNHNHRTPMGVIANSELRCLASVEDEHGEDKSAPRQDSGGRGTEDIAPLTITDDQRVNLPRRLFINMELTNGEHPFFRRCWTATHVIDEKSPLIRKKMRDRIIKNHGFWPARNNNAAQIKRNLKFKQIIVNFTGVSKRTSKEVHAQRVYEYGDVIVGYQFVNVLHKGDEDNVVVRGHLLNDITEQNGEDKGEDLTSLMQ